MKAKKNLDMTRGNIFKLLIMFSLPLMAGNIFQQLYNTVDSIVVGNYVGKEALASVGSVTPLINTFIGFFMGLSTGGSVIISQCFGAKDFVKLRKAVHTMIVGTIFIGIIFTALGIMLTPVLLRFMSTPDDVFESSRTYLTIYFSGTLALMIYNMGSGILRAVGDSRRPLYILIFSTVLNMILDLIFVVAFRMGIAGVAHATIICETITAILVLVLLSQDNQCYRLSISELKIDFPILKKILIVGLPAGLQMAITSFSNIFVQGYINRFGSSCMAGWTSYGKIDQFAILPIQSISLACTTFVGQNYGAKQIDRVKEGIKKSTLLSFCVTVILIAPIILFSRQLVQIFNRDDEVVYFGRYFIYTCIPFYVLLGPNQIRAGSLRGLGNATAPMIIMLGSFVMFRQIYLYTATRLSASLLVVAMGYPCGWIVCCIIMYIYFTLYMHRLSRKTEPEI